MTLVSTRTIRAEKPHLIWLFSFHSFLSLCLGYHSCRLQWSFLQNNLSTRITRSAHRTYCGSYQKQFLIVPCQTKKDFMYYLVPTIRLFCLLHTCSCNGFHLSSLCSLFRWPQGCCCKSNSKFLSYVTHMTTLLSPTKPMRNQIISNCFFCSSVRKQNSTSSHTWSSICQRDCTTPTTDGLRRFICWWRGSGTLPGTEVLLQQEVMKIWFQDAVFRRSKSAQIDVVQKSALSTKLCRVSYLTMSTEFPNLETKLVWNLTELSYNTPRMRLFPFFSESQ